MAQTLEGKVCWFAVFSRIAVLSLQVITNLVIPDHQPDVFNPPVSDDGRVCDAVAEVLLGGLRRWDGVYYLHIAEHGYTYQNCLAFFPLFPLFVRFLSNTLLFPIQCVLSYRYVLQLAAVLVNLYCFLMAALMLFRLGVRVLNNKTLAYKAALLFCINPASIFMTAPYTEAMFCYLSFRGMYHLEEKKNVRSSIRFCAGALVRSNGLTNFGFIYYGKLKVLVLQLLDIKNTGFVDWASVRAITSGVIFLSLGPTLFYTVIMFLPFALWQYYAFIMYCKPDNQKAWTMPNDVMEYGKSRGYVVLGSEPEDWCRNTLPLSYSHIQSSHWGLGLFKYYELKQIPNFLLAAPIVSLCVSLVWMYIRRNPRYSLTLGLIDEQTLAKKTDDQPLKTSGLFGADSFVYVAHLMFLLIFGVVFMHIQVLTRLLFSSTPVLFWFAAWLTTSTPEGRGDSDQVNRYDVMKPLSVNHAVESQENLNSPLSNLLTDQLSSWKILSLSTKLVYIYFISYFIIGTTLFSNFLPWT